MGGLLMAVADVLVEGRHFAEQRMTESVRIVVRTIETVEATGAVELTDSEPIYDGIARYKSASTAPGEDNGAGQQYVKQKSELHLPIGSPIVPVNSIAVIDASSEDEALVGVELRITARPSRGQATALRFPIEEVSR